MSGSSGLRTCLRILSYSRAAAGIIVSLFNILIASIAEGSLGKGFLVFLTNGIFVYLIPPAVGVQMGLFRYHRN